MTMLALYSNKGGVGKTAAAVNLSYRAALTGARTLICDLDPQSSATYYFLESSPSLSPEQRDSLKGAKRSIKTSKALIMTTWTFCRQISLIAI